MATLTEKRQWAKQFEKALEKMSGETFIFDEYEAVLHSGAFAEGTTFDVTGNNKGREAVLLKKDAGPALVLRLTITKNGEVVRSEDDPWIIINKPFRPGKAGREQLLDVIEPFVRGH